MAGDVTTRYSQGELSQRRKDRYLGTAVGGSAVGLGALEASTRPGSLAQIKGASRGAQLVINGKPYPLTAKGIAGLRSLRGPSLKHMAAAGLLGVLAGGGRRALRDREDKRFVAKSDTWKELKSQTVYGMPSHQTDRMGARGRAEAMARSIPDPALPFVAPKGERRKAAAAQAKATASGAAIGTTAGLAAGALVGGPKAWKASGRNAAKALKQLKGMANAKSRPSQAVLPGMKPTSTQRLSSLKRKAAGRFTAQRRADLARGAVGGAVTGAAVNINSANAAKETVASNPEAWTRNDKKIQGFVNKGDAMPSLAEIAKRASYAESESTRNKYGAGAAVGMLGGAGAIDYGVSARRASRTNRETSRYNAKNRRAHMDASRRSVASAERAARHGRQAFGTGSFTSDKASGMRGVKRIYDSHLADAGQSYARGRRSGKLAAQQRAVAMGQAKRGKWALVGGGAAIAGGAGLGVYGSRKKKVRKDIEPDVDPSGFLEQVKRQNEALRDSGGRFAGKVVDDVGPAVIAAPYAESEEA